MGRCHRLCLSVGLFHLYIRLSELSDTLFFSRKIAIGRRFPIGQQDELRPSCPQHAVTLPARPAYHTSSQHEILHRMAPMGLSPSQRIRPGETQRHRCLQLSGRRYGSRETTQPGLLHPVLPRRPGSRKPQQSSVRRYYLPSGRSSGKLCETMCGLTGRHVQHCQ